MLDLHKANKGRGHILRNSLEASGLAIPVILCGKTRGLGDCVQPAYDRTKGVGKTYVIPTGIHRDRGLRVSSEELIKGGVILLNQSVQV